MIKIAGSMLTQEQAAGLAPHDGVEAKILSIMMSGSGTYEYSSTEELKFELAVRAATVNAAKELARSGIQFRDFRKSKANPDYWQRTGDGGFRLQSGVKPVDAINDIFENGSQYGTECATAIVIIFYKALADVLPAELFNKLFSDIELMDWQHLDSDLGVDTIKHPSDYLPGDGRYFKNPDVDPLTPQWQGENVIDLGGGRYYGHGIGVTNAKDIIDSLNSARTEGSDTPAYLMDQAERLDYNGLYKKMSDFNARQPAAREAAAGFMAAYSY